MGSRRERLQRSHELSGRPWAHAWGGTRAREVDRLPPHSPLPVILTAQRFSSSTAMSLKEAATVTGQTAAGTAGRAALSTSQKTYLHVCAARIRRGTTHSKEFRGAKSQVEGLKGTAGIDAVRKSRLDACMHVRRARMGPGATLPVQEGQTAAGSAQNVPQREV